MSSIPVTEDSRIDLEETIARLEIKKDNLMLEKKQWELKMSLINDKLRNKYMLNSDFQVCQKEKNDCKSEIYKIEQKLAEIKSEISGNRINLERIFVALKQSGNSVFNTATVENNGFEMMEDIKALKIEWAAFSADHTRVSSMRLMASKFVSELDIIIKKHRDK